MTLQDALAKLEALGLDRMVREARMGQLADRLNSNIVNGHADAEALREQWMAAEMPAADPAAQWTMNDCLAGIGIHRTKLRTRALALGEAMGIFRDYPVSKGCTSPFAPIWINEMVRRAAATPQH